MVERSSCPEGLGVAVLGVLLSVFLFSSTGTASASVADNSENPCQFSLAQYVEVKNSKDLIKHLASRKRFAYVTKRELLQTAQRHYCRGRSTFTLKIENGFTVENGLRQLYQLRLRKVMAKRQHRATLPKQTEHDRHFESELASYFEDPIESFATFNRLFPFNLITVLETELTAQVLQFLELIHSVKAKAFQVVLVVPPLKK